MDCTVQSFEVFRGSSEGKVGRGTADIVHVYGEWVVPLDTVAVAVVVVDVSREKYAVPLNVDERVSVLCRRVERMT